MSNDETGMAKSGRRRAAWAVIMQQAGMESAPTTKESDANDIAPDGASKKCAVK